MIPDAGSAAPVLENAPEGGYEPAPSQLELVPQPGRGRGRRSVLWAVVTVVAVVAGPAALAAWLAACAAVAALQTATARAGREELPLGVLAAAAAASMPLAALGGLPLVAAAAGGAVMLVLVGVVVSLIRSRSEDTANVVGTALALGLAAASVVLLREVSVHGALLLLAYTAAYDASAFVVGTGAKKPWEGPVAGVLMLVPVTMLSAVFPLDSESTSLVLGVIAALLTPCGPVAADRLLGDAGAGAAAPALRRLDSLIVLAPIWSLFAVAAIS